MTIIHFPNRGFKCVYDFCGLEAEINYGSDSIIFKDATSRWRVELNNCVIFESYQKQYGIEVSLNYKCFFVETWEKGLFCFDLKSGNMLWHNSTIHAEDVFLASPNTIICFFRNFGIKIIEIVSGKELATFSIKTDDAGFWRASEKRFLVGPIRHFYYLIDEKLKPKYKVKDSIINSDNDDYFILHDASLVDEDTLKVTITACSYSKLDDSIHTRRQLERSQRVIDLRDFRI